MRVRLGDYIKEYSVKNKNNEDIPVYSVSNSLGFCKDYFGKEVASKNKTTYKIVPRGCFAYNPSRINVGSVDWQNEEERVIVSPLYNVFSVSPLLDQQYLLYYLKSNVILSRIRAVASGSVRDNLKLSMLYEFPIDLISLDQQYDVVSTLNAVQKIIDLYQKGLSYLDELVRARFVEMFGDNKYEELAVEKVCTSIVDCPHTTPKYNGDLRNPAIRTSEIKKGFITWDTMKYVSDEEYIERTARLKPQQGDIVYGREGTFGNAAILPKGYKFCLGQRVMLLRPNNEFCISQYLLRALISDEVYNQALAKNNASTVAHVNVKDVKNFMIPVPPLELQNQFASFVQEIDKSRLLSNQSLFLLKSMIF